MLKTLLRVVTLCGLAIWATSPMAQAQSRTKNIVNSVALKLGAFFPEGADARRVGGKEIVSVEGDYVLQHIAETNTTSILSVGFSERDSLRVLPITITQITRDARRASAYDVYYGYGVGLYSVRLDTAETSGRNKTLFGGLIAAGINLSEKVFAEAKYHFVSRYDRKEVGGLQLMVGLRL